MGRGVDGQFSPDGRWVVYDSNESGKYEIYVAPSPGPGGKWQISTARGYSPRWRRDGVEIFYLSLEGKLMAATVRSGGATFEVGVVKPLFDARVSIVGNEIEYDLSLDGQRLLPRVAGSAESAPISVVLNWNTDLKK